MASKILIKRSTTASDVPTTSDLDTGELAVNTADKRVYTNNSGTIVELGTYPSSLAVAANATVGGTLGVTGATTLSSGTVSGNWTVTGTLTVSTPTASTHAASKGYVDTAVANVIDAAPGALDTLNELAAAINDDANFATTITTALATKLPLAGGTMTGAIDMGSNKITTTYTPTDNADLTTKTYVDGILGSATSAATSATAAASSASDAATSATNAATSATTATTQASAASTSATNAASSASAASTSASSASTSATAAATSATTASTAATNAAASYDSFDDRYLGAKSSAPSVDNDGDALVTGALYYDTTAGGMYVYTGSAWEASFSGASGVLASANNLSDVADAATARTNLGLGTAATTAATDYVAVSGDTMTGNLDFGDNVEARFGATQDLRVFHDGSGGNSHVLSTNPYLVLDASTAVLTDCNLQPNSGSFDLGTAGIPWRDTYTTGVKNNGAMTIRGSGYVYLQSYAGEQMVRCTENAGVELFYNNDAKLASTSTGVTVTGRAVGTQVTDNDLSFDLQAGNSFVCTPAANGTLTFTNITAGQSGNIILINTGGYAISAAATTYISAADVTTISTAGIYLLSYNSASSNVFVSASAALTSAGA